MDRCECCYALAIKSLYLLFNPPASFGNYLFCFDLCFACCALIFLGQDARRLSGYFADAFGKVS